MPTGKYRPDYQRVADGVTEKIRTGEWPPGAELPTGDDLAVMFTTSSSTVDRAMMLLRAAGLVEGRQGKRVYVADPLPPAQPGGEGTTVGPTLRE